MSNDSNQGEGLTFVVTTNPSDRSSAANKKRIRSLAALRSWPERRRKTFDHLDQSGLRGGFVLNIDAPIAGSSWERVPKQKAGAAPTQGGLSSQHEVCLEEEPLFEKCTRASNECCSCIHCRSEKRYGYGPSQGDSTLRVTIRRAAKTQTRKRTADGQLKPRATEPELVMAPPPAPSPLTVVNNVGRAEPFSCYPVPYRPWFDRILHHMMTIFAPRGWPALKITNAEGLMWESFMTQHALSEPALFYVRLLFASGDMIRLRVLNAEVTFWLQAQAIISINEALTDPKRASSDALILAVGRIALHEALYGDKKAASAMHRPAQKRMIQMRGGMRELPFPELVKRLMRWSDNVMAMQTGTERMLEDDEQTQNFSMKEHVDVLEKWVPTEGQDLRKKIKITDLLAPDQS
ncbi:hypothetical protein LTR37_012682 [Vermiconidia calcicola]|uniref:Uncharacterized protein n=1 Tax=Vermiconidia calcicola TaxID=1690605 RepID=A0ACC3MZK4_9PEZI|nr:hypothetical protein LTR37_012682 [Vermiconidia calcicola]